MFRMIVHVLYMYDICMLSIYRYKNTLLDNKNQHLVLINDHSLITADKFSSGQSWIRNDAYHTCTWILQYSIFKVSVSFLLRGIYICWNCWKFSIYSCLCIYHIRGQNVHNSLDHTETIVLVYCIQRRDKQIYI